MKIIDLLNKIANGEKIPHIQYDDIEAYLGADGYLKDQYGDNVEWWIDKKWLNRGVKIIEEEKKIPEKIPEKIIVGKKQPTHRIKKIEKKINEIIDYLDYLKSKGE